MMCAGDEVDVSLCREPVDFRKQINGLAILGEQELRGKKSISNETSLIVRTPLKAYTLARGASEE